MRRIEISNESIQNDKLVHLYCIVVIDIDMMGTGGILR